MITIWLGLIKAISRKATKRKQIKLAMALFDPFTLNKCIRKRHRSEDKRMFLSFKVPELQDQ